MLAHGFVIRPFLLRLLIYMNVITLVLLSIIVGWLMPVFVCIMMVLSLSNMGIFAVILLESFRC